MKSFLLGLDSDSKIMEEALISHMSKLEGVLKDIADQFAVLKFDFKKNKPPKNHEGLEILLLDAHGQIRTSTSAPGVSHFNFSFENQRWFQQWKNPVHPQNMQMSLEVIFTQQPKTNSLLLCIYPLWEGKEKFQGLVVAVIPTETFVRLRQKTELHRFSHFMIAASSNPVVLWETATGENSMDIPPNFHSIKTLDKNTHRAIYRDVTIEKKATYWKSLTRVGNYDLLFVIGESEHTILKDWKRESAILILIVLLITSVGFGLLFRFFKTADALEKQNQTLIYSSKFAAIGEMAGGVAHEVNNPLAVIQLKSSILMELIESGEFDQETVIEDLKIIIHTTERIAKIVNGLLAISKNTEKEPNVSVKLGSIIQESVALNLDRYKVLGVHLELGPVPFAYIFCRPIQISQVLLNLLGNALDAVTKNDEKWVKVDTLLIENQTWVEISVTDSGKGIERGISQKIMEPFFTTKNSGKGTGLGLSISKSLVEQHGGTLELDGLSKNTRFVVRLPLKYGQSNLNQVANG